MDMCKDALIQDGGAHVDVSSFANVIGIYVHFQDVNCFLENIIRQLKLFRSRLW